MSKLSPSIKVVIAFISILFIFGMGYRHFNDEILSGTAAGYSISHAHAQAGDCQLAAAGEYYCCSDGGGSDSGGGGSSSCQPDGFTSNCTTTYGSCPGNQQGENSVTNCVDNCGNSTSGTGTTYTCACPSGTTWDGSTCQTDSTGGGSSCTNVTTDQGCAPGYTGHDYVTMCGSTRVSDDNQCTPDQSNSCADTYTWVGCNSGTVHDGQPPAGTQYEDEFIYSWAYPNCGTNIYGPSGVQVIPGNCPSCPDTSTQDLGCPAGYHGTDIETTTYTAAPACSPMTSDNNQCVPNTATISVSDNTSGGWSINGTPGTGSGQITVTPSTSGTTYTIAPSSVSGYDYPPTITNSVTGSGSSFVLFANQSASFGLSYALTPPPFDYSLSNSGNVSVMKGGRDQYGQDTITKTLTSGATQSTDLSLSGVPANVDYQIAASTCNATCSATITFTVHPSATAGTYPITVTGSSPTHTTSFNLIIQNSPDIIASCSASPSSALVGQTVTWTGSVSGGVPPFTYTWSGTNIPTAPAPTTNPFSIVYSTVGAKTAQIHVTDSLGNVGVCNAQTGGASIQINFNPQFQEF